MGQKLNKEKTTVFLSKSTLEGRKFEILDLLGVSEVRDYNFRQWSRETKRRVSTSLRREWSKLQGWKEKLLLQAGREVLLKAVVQTIPTFAMICFKLPSGLLNNIEMMIRKFWWGQRGDQ